MLNTPNEISNPADYKAALYIRLSKEDGTEKESESVTNQRSLLQDFVSQQKLAVFSAYIDDGYSGTNFERPEFQRMIADIKAGKVNLVLTKDMSRLGRDYIQTGYYLERFFPENRVRYISLLDGIDTGVEHTMNDITPFKAIMNDMYAKDISKKITSVKRDKQRKGLFIGGKAPYGYKLSREQKNTLEIDAEAATIVQKIFHLALSGKSCREIALMLNAEGIPTPAQYANLSLTVKGPYSGKWSAERIAFMLKNQAYIGDMVQGRTRKLSYKIKKSVRLPPEQWIVVPNTHAPLINRKVFDKVQLLIESRKQTRSRKYDYLLKGIIHCHECGYPLGVIKRTLSGNRSVLYFICRTYQRFTSYKTCTAHCLRVETVTNAVLEELRQFIQEHLNQESCAAMLALALQKGKIVGGREKERTKATIRLKALTIQLDKMYADKLNGTLEAQDFQRIYAGIKQERSDLQKKIKTLQAAQTENHPLKLELPTLMNQFLETCSDNKELIFSLIERVELTKNKEIKIFFRFSKPK